MGDAGEAPPKATSNELSRKSDWPSTTVLLRDVMHLSGQVCPETSLFLVQDIPWLWAICRYSNLAESNLRWPNDEIHTKICTVRTKGFSAKEMVSPVPLFPGKTSKWESQAQHREASELKENEFVHEMKQILEAERSLCILQDIRCLWALCSGRAHPAIDGHFRNHLSSRCSGQADPAVALDNGSASSFDSHYYRNLKGGKGLLYVDQALMEAPITRSMVHLFASNQELFYRDFSVVVVILFNLNVLTGKQGQIRKECSKLVNSSRRSRKPVIGKLKLLWYTASRSLPVARQTTHRLPLHWPLCSPPSIVEALCRQAGHGCRLS
ncbi:hypothetical protein SUGI_0977530 [Cryptomeria japonica]|nr:hypothetical protein SUGI_0977530 [Cryptomeria japonica]